MNLVETADLWILIRIQRFSDWIYDLISLDNFTTAKTLLVGSGILLCISNHLFFGSTSLLFILNNLILPIYICSRWWMTYNLIEINTAIQSLDPYRKLRKICLVLVAISVVLFPGSIISWALTCFLASLYFASCKKPPKKKSKAKEALEKAKERVQALLQPAPQFTMNARSPRCSGASVFLIFILSIQSLPRKPFSILRMQLSLLF